MTDICVETYPLDLTSDQCGYPLCCPGNQPKFRKPAFPNDYINYHLDMWPDMEEFILESGEIFHKTGMPMFPCLCHHFCLPFSPICAAAYCAKRRMRGLENLLQNWNEHKGLRKGVYLKWNEDYITASST